MKVSFIMTNFEYLELVMQTSFPYDIYSEEELHKSFFKLKNNTLVELSNIGMDIVKYFHPSIWRCNRNGYKSPVDAWQDPEIMLKVIDNRLKYLKTNVLSTYNLRSGLSIGKFAPKVSVFRPATARYLINKYLSNFNTIFDPCSGFSGRLLGTCSMGKSYIGQDINSITIQESKKVIEFFNLDAKLCCKDSLYDTGIYDCLFTCPPYGNKENWHQDIEVLSCDEWIDTCLANYTCNTYLFVVDSTEKYKQYIVDTVKNQSHFSTNNEQVILIK